MGSGWGCQAWEVIRVYLNLFLPEFHSRKGRGILVPGRMPGGGRRVTTKYAKFLCEKCGREVSTGYRSEGYSYICQKCYDKIGNHWIDSIIKLEVKK